MNTRTIYLIYIRPPGSFTWTQHLNPLGIPWRSSDPAIADQMAVILSNGTKYCSRVVSIELPKDADDVDHPKYAHVSNGDTIYVSSV